MTVRLTFAATLMIACASSSSPPPGHDATARDTTNDAPLEAHASDEPLLDAPPDAAPGADIGMDADAAPPPDETSFDVPDADVPASDVPDADAPPSDILPMDDARVDAADADASGAWPCPRDWVRHESGGCGPAVLLCAGDGGAASGACAGLDLTRPHPVADPDGGAGASFYRLPDGGVGGAWSERPWPCPAGWRARPDGTCDPALPEDCPPGSAPLPGARCTPTAPRDCPPGDFPDVSAEAGDARLVRVRPGATPGGDGSEGRPFAALADALPAAGPGGWVLLAAGTYREPLDLSRSVHIVGRCAALVRIEAPEGMAVPAADVSGSATSVELRRLTLTGRRFGVHVRAGAALSLRESAVVASSEDAIFTEGDATRLTQEDVRVAETRVRTDGHGGIGVRVGGAAMVTIRRAALEDNREFGLWIATGVGPVEFTDSTVRRTQWNPGDLAAGVMLSGRGSLRVERCAIDDNPTWGVVAEGSGARAVVEDVVISRTGLGVASAQHGGLGARSGAQVTAARVRLSENTEAGVHTRAGGAVLEITDAWIERTRAKPGGDQSNGLIANAASALRARRVVVRDSEAFGVAAETELSEFPRQGELDITDSLVEDTRLRHDGFWGLGLGAHIGGRVRATRVVVLGSREVAVGASGTAEIDLRDVIVIGTTPSARGFGVGVGASVGAQVRFERLAVQDVHGAGVITDQHVEELGLPPGLPIPGARVAGSDLFLRAVQPSTVVFNSARPGSPAGTAVAYGVTPGRSTSVTLTRAVLSGGSHGLALFAPLALTDGVIAAQGAAGFRNSTALPGPPMLDRVAYVMNGREDIVVDDTLPEGSLPVSRD